MQIPRRAAVSLGLLAVVGCAPTHTPETPAATVVVEPEPSPENTPEPMPEPSPETTPEPTPEPSPGFPTREEIEGRFDGEAPTQWGLEVDGVVLRHEQAPVVLTFDACGGPNGSGVDEALLAVLAETGTPATMFINARWAEANPAVVERLIADPLFEIANHGTRHLPLSVTGEEAYGIPGTASVGEVYDEVVGAQEMLTRLLGEPPRFFRSGTAHYDDVAVRIVTALGLQTVNFDINADAGATFTAAQVHAAVVEARGGSICLGHFNRPGSGTAEGIARAIPELSAKGLGFSTLGQTLAAATPHPEG